MTIECDNIHQFFEAISALVERGLTFKADMHRYVITLTGGF